MARPPATAVAPVCAIRPQSEALHSARLTLKRYNHDYQAAGFKERRGKGDHTVYAHPLVPKHYAVDGRDGADALPYDERNLREALQEAERRRQP